ncbi:MAG: CRTAC1 family protein [Verrucomicrobiota bacterium]|nr:CRTAC1 family protein [Verrucomicrobiota bacterium]
MEKPLSVIYQDLVSRRAYSTVCAQLIKSRTALIPIAALISLIGCNDKSINGDTDKDSINFTTVTLEKLKTERTELDQTVFADETQAVRHEEVFIRLWDELRNGDPYKVLTSFSFDNIILGEPVPNPSPEWGVPGIKFVSLNGTKKELNVTEFRELLSDLSKKGWKLKQSEWHHTSFQPASNNSPARSIISCELHCLFNSDEQRIIVRGKLKVTWTNNKEGQPIPSLIDTTGLEIIARKGKSMFTEIMNADPGIEAPGRFPRFSPLLVRDLDGDGLSEIVTAGCNLVYKNEGNGKYTKRDFLKNGINRPAEAGLLADLNGDGLIDYIGGNAENGTLLFFPGSEGGQFIVNPQKINIPPLKGLHTISAGDIDGDRDLDLFIGQWKAPYIGGSMPTPYYNANDGYPDYLLRNEGNGTFVDITNSSGLSEKSNRRTFSASLIDLDFDQDLDLVVVADFSGLDLYLNDGKGHFSDITDQLGKERHAFGMSHTFGDWNSDGIEDLCLVGMSSTTARRLDGLGISKPGYEKYSEMRAPMTFGNRLYVRNKEGALSQPSFTTGAARSGWSWGCAATDFDLDGDTDLYVANGHISGKSAKDYCTRFWCHDLYTGNSKPNEAIDSLFKTELLSGLGRDFSWNGFEHNAMFINLPNKGFLNASFLLGTAFEYDSRAVIAADLDENGTQDLIVIEYQSSTMKQRMHMYRNHGNPQHSWVGIKIKNSPGMSPIGTVISMKSKEREWSKTIVTGDGFTSQGPAIAHFGLGKINNVSEIEVRWPTGEVQALQNPKINQYHLIEYKKTR